MNRIKFVTFLSVLSLFFFFMVLPAQAEESSSCFAFISDAHVDEISTYQNNFKAAINYFNNHLKPPFIIDGGDIVSKGKYLVYQNIIKNSLNPVYVVPGNHDRGCLVLGVCSAKIVINFNSYRLIGFDSLAIDYSWLEAQLKDAPLGKIVLFAHYPVETPTYVRSYQMNSVDRSKIENLMTKYSVRAFLSGHAHEPFNYYNATTGILDIGAPATARKRSFQKICLTGGGVTSSLVGF